MKNSIKAFSCGRGMIVAFNGNDILKNQCQYIHYHKGIYTLISDYQAKTFFDKLKITVSYMNHVTSNYFSPIKLDKLLTN